MRRRILKDFRLDEISVVDRPAQVGARVTLMKSDSQATEAFTKQDVDSLAKTFTARGVSERLANNMAVARLMRKAGIYEAGFLAPSSQRELWARDYSVVNKAVGDFRKRVQEIASRDGCSKAKAMQRARIEHPDEFAAYQTA